MARPEGSKNKRRRPERRQHQIRLTDAERAVQEVAASHLGLAWGEWARQVLRQASGLPALAPYEAKTSDSQQST